MSAWTGADHLETSAFAFASDLARFARIRRQVEVVACSGDADLDWIRVVLEAR